MTSIALLALAAALALALATRLRLPAPPLMMAAGIGLTLAGAPLDERLVRSVLLLGATFLVFVVGTELDPERVGAHRRAAGRVAWARIAVLTAAGVGTSRALGLSWLETAYVTVALNASSTLLVTDLLRQRQQFFEPFGRLVLGASRVQDLVVVGAVSVLAVATVDLERLAMGGTGLVALVAGAALLGRWIGPRLLARSDLDQEHQLLVALGALFLFAGVAHYAGLPLATGAFLAGLALARFPVRALVSGHVASFSDFFTALFYVALGATVRPLARAELWTEAALLTAIVLFAPLVVLPLVRERGMTLRSSIEGINLMAHSGELALVVAMVGLARGHLGEDVFEVIVGVVVATSAIAPMLSADALTWRLVHLYPAKRADAASRPSGHLLVIGCGESTRPLIDEWTEAGEPVVVIDDDPAVVEELRAAGARVVRGDGADPAVLEAAGAAHARVVISTMRRLTDNERLLSRAPGARVLVRVFSDDDAARVRALGGEPVEEAALAEAPILAWVEATRPT